MVLSSCLGSRQGEGDRVGASVVSFLAKPSKPELTVHVEFVPEAKFLAIAFLSFIDEG